MAHHLGGMSNSAKRRQAASYTHQDMPNGRHDMLNSMTKAGADAFIKLQSRFGNLCKVGKEKVAEAEQAVEEQIQHRPVVSILGALGVGMIIGAFSVLAFDRRRR
jgi:hypothetical protein